MLSFVEIILALTCFVTVRVPYTSLRIRCSMREQHVDVEYHYVRDIVEQGKLKVCKISTHDNPADMLTKPVPVAKFELCSDLVGITH